MFFNILIFLQQIATSLRDIARTISKIVKDLVHSSRIRINNRIDMITDRVVKANKDVKKLAINHQDSAMQDHLRLQLNSATDTNSSKDNRIKVDHLHLHLLINKTIDPSNKVTTHRAATNNGKLSAEAFKAKEVATRVIKGIAAAISDTTHRTTTNHSSSVISVRNQIRFPAHPTPDMVVVTANKYFQQFWI